VSRTISTIAPARGQRPHLHDARDCRHVVDGEADVIERSAVRYDVHARL
jgi:hypothetical protein